jgi:C4-dicarboxylate transporter
VLKYVWTGMISAFAFIVWLVIAAMVFGLFHGLRTR